MPDQPVRVAASKVRRILAGLGIRHVVGTSWNDHGDPVVVVDVPPNVDASTVKDNLNAVGADVVVRHATRSIIAN